MTQRKRSSKFARPLAYLVAVGLLITAAAYGALINMTLEDFHTSGTQVGDVELGTITPSSNCMLCHGPFDPENDPWSTWKGSLMANAGRDPLFFAQMTTANQDVANVGYFCMRCHIPMTFVTGHAYDTDGSTIDEYDRDGINCHFCHSMVDPIYKEGISPTEDVDVLAGMKEVPEYYGNAMFVLDPTGLRRGPRPTDEALHDVIVSPFHTSGDFCGTCHDVGNLAVSKQPDGTYRYNSIDESTPDEDLYTQFPLERTYTEWKLSAFANGGVDMGGLFGGEGVTVVSTCQDCHMPRGVGQACIVASEHDDLARHDFAGAAAPILDLIAEYYQDDPDVDLEAIAAARAKSVSMLERAASLDVVQACDSLRVRVFNETGHKLPTGHIEGRRVWVNVQYHDGKGQLVGEYGHYDYEEAHLDEESTTIYEMHVGLSDYAAGATGYPAGVTGHMALADTIEKDNRIPPRGFNNETYEAGGAPSVGTDFADGQYWHDTLFDVPNSAATTTVTVYYQNLPRHYIEALRDGNVTDHWGDTLFDLWETTGKGEPIAMTSMQIDLDGSAANPADLNCDGTVDATDLAILLGAWGPCAGCPADIDGDGVVGATDLAIILGAWG